MGNVENKINDNENSSNNDLGEIKVFKVIKKSDSDKQPTRRMVVDKELLKEKTENENIVNRKKDESNKITNSESIKELFNKNELIVTNNSNSLEDIVTKEKMVIMQEEDTKKRKVKKLNIFLSIVLGIILIAGIVLFSTVFAIVTKNTNTIVDGIYINNIDVGGLTKEEAIKKVEVGLNSNINTISFYRENYTKVVGLEKIDGKFDVEEAIQYAFEYGRKDTIIENNYKIVKAKLFKENKIANLEYNEEKVDELIDIISLDLPDLALDSTYMIKDNKLIIKNSTSGVRIKKEDFINGLKKAFTTENKLAQIPVKQCEKSKVDLNLIYNQIHKEPADAYYTTDPYEIFKEENGVDFAISLNEAMELLKEDKDEYEIPLIEVKPSIVLENLDNGAFPDKLAVFTTTYGTDDVNRNTNVALAAKSINSVILMPGEVFSFNDLIGDCTVETGYKPATIFLNGKLSMGIGGGICQVSTTLYNAVIRANLEIIERRNHSMGVTYVPSGQDAMVSIGTSDFKFKNNRTYPIKVVSYTGVGSISCEVYGLKQDTEYTVELYSRRISQTETHYKVETYKILKLNGQEVSRTLISTDTYKFN